MRKIANTDELQDELREVLAYTRTAYPSRSKVASQLLSISERLGAAAAPSEASRKNKANKALDALCRGYHKSIPLTEIKEILSANGFNDEAVDGIYTGREGRSHEQVGPKTWMMMTWHKMEESGTWEVVAYLS